MGRLFTLLKKQALRTGVCNEAAAGNPGERCPGGVQTTVAAWIAAASLLVLAAVAGRLDYSFNETSSVPVGLWRIVPLRAPLERGQIVSFCPPGRSRFSAGPIPRLRIGGPLRERA